MSDAIVLDTPQQITMWVLLSRRSQIKLHLKGVKVPGLVKWCRQNIEGCENARTVRDCIIPVETEIAMKGGPQDYTLVNVHVMFKRFENLFYDRGIFPDMAAVEAKPEFVALYQKGLLEIVYTLDEPREPNEVVYQIA